MLSDSDIELLVKNGVLKYYNGVFQDYHFCDDEKRYLYFKNNKEDGFYCFTSQKNDFDGKELINKLIINYIKEIDERIPLLNKIENNIFCDFYNKSKRLQILKSLFLEKMKDYDELSFEAYLQRIENNEDRNLEKLVSNLYKEYYSILDNILSYHEESNTISFYFDYYDINLCPSRIDKELFSDKISFRLSILKTIKDIEWLRNEIKNEEDKVSNLEKMELDKENNELISSNKTFHSTQFVILQKLGFFDLEQFSQLTTIQKGEFMGKLLNMDKDNATDYLGNIRYSKTEDKNKKSPYSKTAKNQAKEILSLISIDLDL